MRLGVHIDGFRRAVNVWSVGRFRGVSNANAIRDLMLERLRQYRDSGLGEPALHNGPGSDRAIDAARAVLAEARALRAQLASSTPT